MAINSINTAIWWQVNGRKIVRASNGDLYCVYLNVIIGSPLKVGKSTDNGITWVNSTIATAATTNTNLRGGSIAIDSQDNLHVVYCDNDAFSYAQVRYIKYTKATESWGAVTTLSSGSFNNYSPTIGIDAYDNLHVAYVSNGTSIKYFKYSDGVWGSIIQIATYSSGSGFKHPEIAADKNNDIHVVFNGGDGNVYHVKYSAGVWAAKESIGLGDGVSYSDPSMAFDNNNDIHVTWSRRIVGEFGSQAQIYYVKFSSGAWGVPINLTADTDSEQVSSTISVNSNNDIHVIWSDIPVSGDSRIKRIIYSYSSVSWGSIETLTPTGSPSDICYVGSSFYSLWPKVNGIRTNVLAVGSALVYNTTAQGNNGWFFISDDATFNIDPDLDPLPTYITSVITSAARVEGGQSASKFIIGGKGGASGNTYQITKKTTNYGLNIWRSQVFRVGSPFNIIAITFNLTEAVAANKIITPVLNFDNNSRTITGIVINNTNYPNNEKSIELSADNFNNNVHGFDNFSLEFRFSGSALIGITFPITITIETESID